MFTLFEGFINQKDGNFHSRDLGMHFSTFRLNVEREFQLRS